jgi:hypothetical protein
MATGGSRESRLKRVRSLDDIYIDDDDSQQPRELSPVMKPWITQERKKSRGKTKAKGKKSPISSSSLNQTPVSVVSEQCSCCENPCPTSSMQCQFCDDFFHPKCVGLDPATVAKNSILIVMFGWTCSQCKTDLRKILGSHRAGVVAEQENELSLAPHHTGTMDNNKINSSEPILKSKASTENVKEPPRGSVRIESTNTDVVSLVRKTFRDATRRKSNVVVSGLKEVVGLSDAHLASNLFNDQLGLKPKIMDYGTRRLGTATTGANRPRRLLVRLGSEWEATELLRSARYLRDSQNEYVASSVYINPDLSKEEAKDAYDLRQMRRRNSGGLGAVGGAREERNGNGLAGGSEMELGAVGGDVTTGSEVRAIEVVGRSNYANQTSQMFFNRSRMNKSTRASPWSVTPSHENCEANQNIDSIEYPTLGSSLKNVSMEYDSSASIQSPSVPVCSGAQSSGTNVAATPFVPTVDLACKPTTSSGQSGILNEGGLAAPI